MDIVPPFCPRSNRLMNSDLWAAVYVSICAVGKRRLMARHEAGRALFTHDDTASPWFARCSTGHRSLADRTPYIESICSRARSLYNM